MDLDDEMNEPIALKTARGRASTKKKVVVDSETEDDNVEVPETAVHGQGSSQSGRRTHASTALADHLETVAAAAMLARFLPSTISV